MAEEVDVLGRKYCVEGGRPPLRLLVNEVFETFRFEDTEPGREDAREV